MTNHPWKGRGQGHVTNFRIFYTPRNIFGMTKARLQILFWTWSREVWTFRWPTIPQVGVAPVMSLILEIYIPLNLSGMAEARIVKFCAQVGPKSISFLLTNCTPPNCTANGSSVLSLLSTFVADSALWVGGNCFLSLAFSYWFPVSYTHLTLPTNREV